MHAFQHDRLVEFAKKWAVLEKHDLSANAEAAMGSLVLDGVVVRIIDHHHTGGVDGHGGAKGLRERCLLLVTAVIISDLASKVLGKGPAHRVMHSVQLLFVIRTRASEP